MSNSGFKITAITLAILFIGPTSIAYSETNNKETFKASFDCAKATSDTEKLICSVRKLADADLEMASIYKCQLSILGLPSAAKQQLKQEQITWLKTRNQCGRAKNIIGCLEDSYRDRIVILKKQMVELNIPSFWCTDVEDNISGRYEKIGEYDYGELIVNQVSSDKLKIKIHASVTNSSCEFGYDYGGGSAEAAYATLVNNNAKYIDDKSCELNLNFIHNQVMITTTKECNWYCGARAGGGMDGVYAKRSDTTESTKYEVLNFEFMDASGTVYHSTKLLKQLKARYGYSAKTVILVETSSLGSDKYKTQESIINSLDIDAAEKLRMLYVVACSSAEHKSGYHTSIKTAKGLSNKKELFRIRLLTEDGHVFNSSDYPLTAEELKIIIKNQM